MTNPASANDDIKGASNAANMKTAMPRLVSNRIGPCVSRLMNEAPIRASQQLLINQQRIIVNGTPLLSSTMRWAGRAAKSKNHHQRLGAKSNAASKIELGGHKVDTG